MKNYINVKKKYNPRNKKYEMSIIANGINVNPEGEQFAKYYPYKVYLKGRILGSNLTNDGCILKPTKIYKIVKN